MAGARRSRRKSGQNDPDDAGQLLDESLGPYARIPSQGAVADDSDVDVDQWLTPFREVQSIRPVVSQRAGRQDQQNSDQAGQVWQDPAQTQAPPQQPPPQQPPPHQAQASQPNAQQYGQARPSWQEPRAERVFPGPEQPRYEQDQRTEPEPKVHRVWSGPEPLPEFGPDRPGWSPQIRPDDRRRLSRQSAMEGSFSGRPADPLIGRPIPPPGRQNGRGRSGQPPRNPMAGQPDSYGQAPGYGPSPDPGHGVGDGYRPGQQYRPRQDHRPRGDGYSAGGGYGPPGYGPEPGYGPGHAPGYGHGQGYGPGADYGSVPGPGPGPGHSQEAGYGPDRGFNASGGYGSPGGYRGDGRGPSPDDYRSRDRYRPRDDYRPGTAYGPRDGFGADVGGYGPGAGYAPGGPGPGAYGTGNGYGYGPGDGPDRGYHPGDPRRPAGDRYGPGNGYDARDRYGPGDPRRGDGYRSAEGYGYRHQGPQGPRRGGYPPNGDYQRGGYQQRDDLGPPDYYRQDDEYARPVGYPPPPADRRYNPGWQAQADNYRDFGPNGPYPGPPHGPFDQAGRGYGGQADYRWPQEGHARDGYGQGAQRFDSEITDRPVDSSAWSHPAARVHDERPEPAPAQRNRPPAALPAGPSSSAAELEQTGTASADTATEGGAFDTATSADTAGVGAQAVLDATAAVASAQIHVPDGVAEVAEVVEIQPSAGMASPTGMVKPPPVAAVSSAAPIVPLPPAWPSPSTPADPPAFGPANGEDIAGPDDDTAPLPVILPDQVPPEAAQSARMRDPFEPIDRQAVPLPRRVPQPDPTAAASSSQATNAGAAKMDQIKDLLLTAEAIGEDALAQHFQQVSERQRQLIREYFDQVAERGTGEQPKI